MTTLIIKHCVLEHDKDILRRHFEARGHEIKRFEFVHWIQNWLKDPAGCFWGRKVLVPKVGDICIATVEPSRKERCTLPRDASWMLLVLFEGLPCLEQMSKSA